MPQVRINERFNNISRLWDVTEHWRRLGKCLYQGFVPQESLSQFTGDFPVFLPYLNYSEFNHKGKLMRRKSIQFPYMVGRYITNNMYAELPDIKVNSDSETKDLLQILSDNRWNQLEKDNFETQFHIGDRVIKPYVVDSEMKFQYIKGTEFLSTRIDNGEIISGIFPTFKTVKKNHKTVFYTRLEWHYAIDEEDIEDTGRTGRIITTQLWKGDAFGQLKTRCTAQDHFLLFGTLLIEREEFLDLNTPTFVFIKNPAQNNKDLSDGRGIGGVVNAIDSSMSMDEAFNSKSTDNVYGAMKIITPEGATEETVDEQGRTNKHYDPSDPSIFVYAESGNMTDSEPKAFAPVLRTDNHIASINVDMDLASGIVGITAGTLRFDGKSIITATQKIIEKTDTARTILEYENANSDGYKRLFMLIRWYSDNGFINNRFTYNEEDIIIDWKDNIAIDDEAILASMKLDSDDGYIAKWRYVMAKYNLTEEEAKQWVAEKDEEEDRQQLVREKELSDELDEFDEEIGG